jgi:hypothetical protein
MLLGLMPSVEALPPTLLQPLPPFSPIPVSPFAACQPLQERPYGLLNSFAELEKGASMMLGNMSLLGGAGRWETALGGRVGKNCTRRW